MEPQRPKPPIPADADLHDFSFTPIYRTRLFNSTFDAHANDTEWRAGVTLWLKSWDQQPAGSLPDNDVELCRLAGFSRNTRAWKKVKPMALHGWYICDDGRLYHRMVADGVNVAYERRKAASNKGKLGASKRWPVIEGGKGNGSAIAQAITQAIPGDSNRQGQGQGQGQGHPEEDKTPLPPLEKGDQRQRRSPDRTRRDQALVAWHAVMATQGATQDLKALEALRAIGGYSRIRLRTAEDEPEIRRAFVDAYRLTP